MSEKDLREDESITMRNLYFHGDGGKIYNSLGQQLTYESLPEIDTLEQDRIVIASKCVGYRVFRFDNLNSTDVLPTKEIWLLPVWQRRTTQEIEQTHRYTYFNYKGEKIKEPSGYTTIEEKEIPWYEKEYDKTGRCYGYRVYNVFCRYKICQFNHYILEQEAGKRYKSDIKKRKLGDELAAKMPRGWRNPETGELHWIDKETGEILPKS